MRLENTMAGQVIKRHLKEGKLYPGEEIAICVDQTLTQDATGTLVYLEFMALGMDRVKTELSVSYVDHNTLQTGFENADDHTFLMDCAQRFKVYFSKAGNGICHQVHLERFARPYKTLLGSDSHTPTAGGVGMLAIGAGGMDVALAMAGIPFVMRVPEIVRVELKGKLPPWVGAKDVILHLLARLSVKGGIGKIFEYTGPGVRNLSVYERATICNMGAELGAWTSIFPSDQVTLNFLKAHGRERDWEPLEPKEGAEYQGNMEIDLSKLEPLIALPHSPDKVVNVREVEGTEVQQVCIGSCTNSSFRDLKMVSQLLRDRKVHQEVSLVISPGSKSVFGMLLEDGSIAHMVKAGARILELACGPCIGMGQAPPSGSNSLRTFNRNFKGRSGTEDANVYLASPEVAVAAALFGKIVHPSLLGDHPKIVEPAQYQRDDSLLLSPPAEIKDIPIRMGPNIRPFPELEPLPDLLEAKVVLKTDDNISTDDILPGGAKVLPFRSNIEVISKFVYQRLYPDLVEELKGEGIGIIVAGQNYGQGSSREHAALAPRYLGIRLVLAKGYARLHRANLINFGIVPALIGDEVYQRIEKNDFIRIENLREIVLKQDTFWLELKEKGIKLPCQLQLSQREREIILKGGILNYYKAQ